MSNFTLQEWIIPTSSPHSGPVPLCVQKASDAIPYPHNKTFRMIQPQHISVYDDGNKIYFVVLEAAPPDTKLPPKEYQMTRPILAMLSAKSPDFAKFVNQYADETYQSKRKAAFARATEAANSPKQKPPIVPPFAQKLVEKEFLQVFQGEHPSESDLAESLKEIVSATNNQVLFAVSRDVGMMQLRSQYAKQAKNGNNIVFLGIINGNSPHCANKKDSLMGERPLKQQKS